MDSSRILPVSFFVLTFFLLLFSFFLLITNSPALAFLRINTDRLQVVIGGREGTTQISWNGFFTPSADAAIDPLTEPVTFALSVSEFVPFFQTTIPVGGLDLNTNGSYSLNQAGRQAANLERFTLTPQPNGNWQFELLDTITSLPDNNYPFLCIHLQIGEDQGIHCLPLENHGNIWSTF